MSDMRPELSKKSKYYIPKERFLELKHFCLQYKKWKEALDSTYYFLTKPSTEHVDTSDIFDPTPKIVAVRKFYSDRIRLMEKASAITDPLLSPWLFKGVTEGKSYESLKMQFGIPCDRNTYYDRYRKFFYILDDLQKSKV